MANFSSHSGSTPKSRHLRRTSRPQVLISFRGVEVCDNLVNWLVRTLQYRGVNGFVDTFMREGVELQPLFKKIEESKIAVVIFSKRFPDSDWCMDELVKIDERAKEGKLVVIPVCFKVEPSHVKRLEGDFGKSFEELKKEFGVREPERILKWENALKSIAKRKALIFQSNIRKVEAPLDVRIANAVQVWLNEMPGGKVNKSPATKTSTGEVIFWAFIAAVLCRFVISPMFFNDAKIFKTRVWLFGFPTLVAILFHRNNNGDKKNPPPSTRPNTSNTGPRPHSS